MLAISIEDLQRRAKLASSSAKLEAQLNGTPYSIVEKGNLLKVYPNGAKKQVIWVNGERKEVDYVES